MSDLYNILGVDRNATEDQLKSAYRKLSKKYHPDINKSPDAEEKFKEIASAYETLSDPNKKAHYDRFGTGGNPYGGGGNPFGGHGFSMDDIFQNFGDIFGGNPFGRQQRTSKGSDLRMKVVLNIDDILKGTTKKLKYKRHVKCDPCSGKGGTDIHNCSTCNGTGQRVVVQNTQFGQIRNQTTCNVCSGTGKEIKNKCGTCHGQGTQIKDEVVDVTIPAGVSTGMQLKMDGFGNDIRDGIPGDLYIVVEEAQDFSYKRDVNNIIVNKTISVIDAICGANIKVDTPHGEMSVNIQPGTEHGSNVRIPGKGIPDINHGMGDLYIKISIKIPKNIELDEKFILEKLKDSKNFQA